MPERRLAAVILLLVLAACGGGGGSSGGAPPPTTITLEMGLVASTVSTRKTVTIANTTNTAATALAGPATGPFALDPTDLPSSVPPNDSIELGVIFSPVGTGDAAGSVTVVLDFGGGVVVDHPVDVTATAEAVRWTVLTPALAFGEVLLGTTRTRVARVRNDSTTSPASLSSASLPAGDFSIVGAPFPTPFPMTVAPGGEANLSIAYAPTSVGAFAGPMMLGETDAGGPLVVALSATTGGAVVTDYGTKTLDANRRTPVLTVDVPADAISLSLEGVMTAGNVGGLAELIGPSGKVYENTSSTGAYVWIPGDEVFSPTIPNSDRTDVQLEPGGGTYSFRLFRFSGGATTMNVRAIVERRPGDTGAVGSLDLDVWLAKVITPKASTATNDSRLQATLATIDSILAQSGIRLGDIRYHDVTDATYDDVTNAEFGPMLKLTSAEADPRLNLFFVRTALGGGVLGVSSSLAGPRRNGTESSGVMSLYDGGYSSSFIGLVAAHEIGHFLGLYHTVESDGSHDFVDDTADCPATGTNGACPTSGGGYLMHWQAVGGTDLTQGQSRVIRGHPCVAADLVPGTALVAASFATTFDLRAQAHEAARLEGGPDGAWCATCARCRAAKGR